jgi:hypothetical protein
MGQKMFTRRHYEAIAKVILEIRITTKHNPTMSSQTALNMLEDRMMTMFLEDNDRFAWMRFAAAANIIDAGDVE